MLLLLMQPTTVPFVILRCAICAVEVAVGIATVGIAAMEIAAIETAAMETAAIRSQKLFWSQNGSPSIDFARDYFGFAQNFGPGLTSTPARPGQRAWLRDKAVRQSGLQPVGSNVVE